MREMAKKLVRTSEMYKVLSAKVLELHPDIFADEEVQTAQYKYIFDHIVDGVGRDE